VSNETKPCGTCAEPIPLLARKCNKCGSYQDLRQYVSFGTTALALVTALFSVATVAVPILYDFLRPDNSNLVASFQGFEGRVAMVLVSNSGKRPGSVNRGTIYILLNHDRELFTSSPILRPERNLGVVEPGTSKAVMFELADPTGVLKDKLDEYERSRQPPLEEMKCMFGFDLVDFSQNRKHVLDNWPCWEVFNFLAQSKTFTGAY